MVITIPIVSMGIEQFAIVAKTIVVIGECVPITIGTVFDFFSATVRTGE
jgi:hypothetical protein